MNFSVGDAKHHSQIVMELVEAVADNDYERNAPAAAAAALPNDEIDSAASSSPPSSSSSSESQVSPTERGELSRQSVEMKLKNDERTSKFLTNFSEASTTSRTSKRKQRRRRRKFVAGDLSCMKAQFVAAPKIEHADIKYIRNEVLGVERSFLEAEYRCHEGFQLIRSSKRKSLMKNKNLICKKRRWLGQRPMCKEIERQLGNAAQ